MKAVFIVLLIQISSVGVYAQSTTDSITTLKDGVNTYLGSAQCNDGLLQVLEQNCDATLIPTPPKGSNELHCVAMAMTAQQLLNDVKQIEALVQSFKDIHCADQQCFNNIGPGGYTQFDQSLSTAKNVYRPRAQGLLNRLVANNHSYNESTQKFIYSTGPSTSITISTTGQDLISRYTQSRINQVAGLYSCTATPSVTTAASGAMPGSGTPPGAGTSSFQGVESSNFNGGTNPSVSREPATSPPRPVVTVAGLSIIDGKGGRIGVSGDNLFNMIHRCYAEERKQNRFLHDK